MAPESMVPYSSLARLVQANVSVASKVNNHNQTALLLHCQRRNASTEVAQLLYDACPESLSTPGWDNGWAALHHAASNINLDLLKFLVQGNPDAALVKTLNGETALHLMCQQNLSEDHLPALQIILQAYPNAVMERDHRRSYTPLHSLCQAGSRTSLEVVKRLFAANPHVAEIADSEHYLPIHHACENGCDASLVQVILDAYPLAANSMTRRQDSALSLACTCNKSVETVKILIQANMSALTKKNDYGFAPLHCVCRAYQPRMGIVETLLDASPNCITLKTHGGETPVHLACSNPNVFIGVLQLLTQNQHHAHGFKDQLPFAIPSMTNKVGNTPRKYNTLEMSSCPYYFKLVSLWFVQCMMHAFAVHHLSTLKPWRWRTQNGSGSVTMVGYHPFRFCASMVILMSGLSQNFRGSVDLRYLVSSIRRETRHSTQRCAKIWICRLSGA
jgi:ankyrin repeat protein